MITAIVVALIGSILLSVILRFTIVESVTVRGILQMAFTGVVAYTMTTGVLPFVVVFLSPIWAFILLLNIVFTVSMLSGVFTYPLISRGYFGNFKKWSLQLNADEEFQAALLVLEDEEVKTLAKTSSDKEHFREQVIERAQFSDP